MINRKKIIILILAIAYFLSFNKVKANSSQSFHEGEWIPNIYLVKAMPNGYKKYQQGLILHRTSDNQFVYCLEPFASLNKNALYQEINYDYARQLLIPEKTWERLNLLSYYGYMYEGHEDAKWYAITQILIWKTLYPDYDFYFSESLNGKRKVGAYQEEINELENLILNHNKTVSFQNDNIKLNIGETITLKDENETLKDYEIERSDIKANIIDNSLIINSESLGEKTITLIKKDKRNLNKPLAYLHDESQNIIMSGYYEPKIINIKVNVNGIAIKITKKDLDTKDTIKIAGLKFKIKNLATNEFVENPDNSKDKNIFLTTSEGFLQTHATLQYGKYAIIEEDSNLKGYLWNKEPLIIDLNKNNVKIENNNTLIYETAFYNKRKKSKIIVEKHGEKISMDLKSKNFSYDFDKLSKTIIGLYAKDPIKDINGNIIYSKDTEIMVKETDANGQITFDNLYLGSYYLQELKTDAKYRLNSRKYSINLEDENKEEVVKAITIQNFLQKGNIIITKTSSLTKENLSNALIGIFNDKDELIYEGTTNQEGKIVIENLALGNYYIKELTAPAGYNLDIKPIRVSITSDKETIYLNLENDPIIDIPDTYSPKCKNIVIIKLIESFVLILCYIQIKKSLNYYN